MEDAGIGFFRGRIVIRDHINEESAKVWIKTLFQHIYGKHVSKETEQGKHMKIEHTIKKIASELGELFRKSEETQGLLDDKLENENNAILFTKEDIQNEKKWILKEMAKRAAAKKPKVVVPIIPFIPKSRVRDIKQILAPLISSTDATLLDSTTIKTARSEIEPSLTNRDPETHKKVDDTIFKTDQILDSKMEDTKLEDTKIEENNENTLELGSVSTIRQGTALEDTILNKTEIDETQRNTVVPGVGERIFNFERFAEIERAKMRKRHIELSKKIDNYITKKAGIGQRGKAVDIYMTATKDIRAKITKHTRSQTKLPPLNLQQVNMTTLDQESASTPFFMTSLKKNRFTSELTNAEISGICPVTVSKLKLPVRREMTQLTEPKSPLLPKRYTEIREFKGLYDKCRKIHHDIEEIDRELIQNTDRLYDKYVDMGDKIRKVKESNFLKNNVILDGL